MSPRGPRPGQLSLPLFRQGKVRDVYEIGDESLLMVASDRVSAFDVVLAQPIPGKGEVLTQLTAWWLHRLENHGIEHHLISANANEIAALHPELEPTRHLWARRAMLVQRTESIPVECVVRAYLSGSAWREYRDHRTLAGEPLPDGLIESGRLPEPIFSPATKAEREQHDENVTPAQVRLRLGHALGDRLEDLSFRIFEHGTRTCAERGVVLADTKFEFGIDGVGRLLLIDEVLTPDSSRFWPRESYRPGGPQVSLDKQPIRDWLDALPDWDKLPPAPDLPSEVVIAATRRYQEAYRRISGRELDEAELPADVMSGP